jgi:EAL domain-containing protein (putative c-di-GMP-specific phosphodiesterase class I)
VHRDDELQRILGLACDHLGMEAAFVSELTETRQVFRAVAGAADVFHLVVDDGPQRSETYCDLMVHGRLPRVVPDTARAPQVVDLAATAAGPIGSYVGVPLRLSDGRLYGTLCCVSRTPDTTLDERDAKFMDLLAAMAAGRVEAIETMRQQHADVRHVLDGEAVDVALQPIVSLTSGRWVGVEGLSRFRGSDRHAEEMFALARGAGVGPDLELLALRLTLATLPDLPADVYLSVNMSPDGIADPRFARLMAECTALPRVVLEVTEHAPVDQYASLLSVVAPMRAAGMRLAVDDVGAGYSSFRHVLHLHPDIIKIDKSLVDGIAHDGALRSIAGNVVLLGLDLRAAIVAEGVEKEDDLAVLEAIGVDLAQGYLFAQPTTDPAVWGTWAAELPFRWTPPSAAPTVVTLPSPATPR